jgi:hypothetical protein
LRALFDSRSGAAASEDAQRANASERPLDGFATFRAANQSHPLRHNANSPDSVLMPLLTETKITLPSDCYYDAAHDQRELEAIW